MQTFLDASGRTWSIHIDVATIRRVRSLAAIDLMQVLGGDLLERLAADPVLLVDVLAAICQPQMDAQRVNAESFASGMLGDAIDHAATALLKGIADFSPSPTRVLLLQLIDAGRAKQAQAQEILLRQVQAMATVTPPPSGASLPSLPESPDSTPRP
ncbi:MAG TPA: hypothetical protein DCS97_07025 [Planctomycetes bacterium]|nr:hypothetical protein [Planctomycetota bacterium]